MEDIMDEEKKDTNTGMDQNGGNQPKNGSDDAEKISWLAENLLKNPLNVISGYGQIPSSVLMTNIILVNILCLLAYGLVVGSFSGGIQWYMSPIKIIAGLALSVLFCSPCFYIFICLAGIDIQPGKALLILLS